MAQYDVTSGVTRSSLTLLNNDIMNVYDGGTADRIKVNELGNLYIYRGGTARNTTVNAGGTMVVSSGGKLTGRMTFAPGASVNVESGSILDFDLTRTTPGADALLNDYMFIGMAASPSFTLTVSSSVAVGNYRLAEMVETFSKTITVVNTAGAELGTIGVGSTQKLGGRDYTLRLDDEGTLQIQVKSAISAAAKSDIDGNKVSDVMFQYTGGDYQLGFWMNGTNAWRGNGLPHPAEWEVLGAYDMNSNGKADSVLVGNVVVNNVKGAYIGYYADSNDTDSSWVNIGYLNNADDIAWKNKVGNLTGNAGRNSIVWHAQELGALGVWTDGTDSWVSLGPGYDSNWTLIGCGDFDGDGKDSVVMSYAGGKKYYAVNLDKTVSPLATSDSGWTVCAIGDFSGDGKDDIVAFHKQTGIVAKWADGQSSGSNWSQLGQLDASDWFVVGAGDYNGDAQDDLLVRRYSTGMLGYYSGGNMSNWVELGRGVDMNWTVIA